MNFQDEEKRFAEFTREHGEVVWSNGWGFCPDGTEIESSSDFGFRFITTRSPEQQHQAKLMYWRLTLENVTQAFHDLKDMLRGKADMGILRDEDTSALRELQEQVRHAAEQLDLLVNPPGPDPKDIRKAKRLFLERQQLATDCREAQESYERAKTRKLGLQWQKRWDAWDAVNTKYLSLPLDVRTCTEAEITQEQEQARRDAQKVELDEIEI